jgi:hypothetical protein
MTQPCQQEEIIGKLKGFMEDYKSLRIQMNGVIIAIAVQICTFLFSWGSMTTTVKKNTEYIWGDLTTNTRENTRNMDKLMTKLEAIKFIAIQGEQGVQGVPGIRGIDGKDSR